MNNSCPNCGGSIWAYSEATDQVYCFYCHYIKPKKNDRELKKEVIEKKEKEV